MIYSHPIDWQESVPTGDDNGIYLEIILVAVTLQPRILVGQQHHRIWLETIWDVNDVIHEMRYAAFVAPTDQSARQIIESASAYNRRQGLLEIHEIISRIRN